MFSNSAIITLFLGQPHYIIYEDIGVSAILLIVMPFFTTLLLVIGIELLHVKRHNKTYGDHNKYDGEMFRDVPEDVTVYV